jgi:drug/metabolite transporter (DMT)-like permease
MHMTNRGLLLLILSSLCTVAANLLMRAGILRSGGLMFSFDRLVEETVALSLQPMFVGGVILYGTAAIIWFRILSTENLSLSYPLMVSMTFVMVTLGACYFFDERMSWRQILGVLVILAGFILTVRS